MTSCVDGVRGVEALIANRARNFGIETKTPVVIPCDKKAHHGGW